MKFYVFRTGYHEENNPYRMGAPETVRVAVVEADTEERAVELAVEGGVTRYDHQVVFGYAAQRVGEEPEQPEVKEKLGFVFPGQGSQKVGMGKDLAERYPAAREVYERADEVLGFSLSKLCFEGPDAELRLTANAQPAILTMSAAILRVLEKEVGLEPAVVAGHSLGEYTALVCAEAMSFEDALRVVRKRGEFMQEAVPVGMGGMAAVLGLEQSAVTELCREAAGDQVLQPANFNSPKQVVIAGHTEAVARAIEIAEGRGVIARSLPVSAPFHCELMQAAATKLAKELSAVDFKEPGIPVVKNVDAKPYGSGASIAEVLVQQVTAPVLWSDCVVTLKELGVERILEVGPGNVLSNLIRQIDGSLKVSSVDNAEQVGELRREELRKQEPPTWEERKQEFMAAGYVLERENMLASPDRMHCVWENGLEWNARMPGACGF